MTQALYISIVLLVGLAGGKLAAKLNLPSVTGYILFGFLLGPSVLNFITSEVYYSLGFVGEVALGMLAISVGVELHYQTIKKFGKNLITLSIGNTLFTTVIVALTTWLLGMEIQYAILLGILALTVSPSGVITVIKEKKAKGEMTQNLVNLVAFDNLICILLFGLAVSLIQSTGNVATSGVVVIAFALLDILYGILLGAVSGIVFSYFIRKKTRSDKLLTILIALLLLNIGIASMFDLSPILSNMITGVFISNLTSRRVLITNLFDRIEMPVFVLFLTLSGAHIELGIVWSVGLIGIAYVIMRSIGRVGGIFLASKFTDLSFKVRKNLGYGLLPQAGIAIGLAAIAERSIPNISGAITGVVLTGVVFFEILGPLILGKVLDNIGETGATK